MECEMTDCEAEAVVFRPVYGVMRHVCLRHATQPKRKRPTLTRPAASLTHKDQDIDSEKCTT